MSRVRVYELAKEAGMAGKALAEKLIGLGYDIKGHSSTVDDETALKIRKEVLQSSDSKLVEKRIDATGGATVIRRRATVIRRRPKKAPEEAADEIVDTSAASQVKAKTEPAAETPVVEPTGKASTPEEPAVEAKVVDSPSADSPVEEKKPKEQVIEEKPDVKETKAEIPAVKEAKIPSRTGIAKVVGTIELPKEERKTSPPRRKGGRPPTRRPAPRPQANQGPMDPAATRGRKKGKKGGASPGADDSRKGSKGGWKGGKKGRKNVRVTRFGYEGDRYDSLTLIHHNTATKLKTHFTPISYFL